MTISCHNSGETVLEIYARKNIFYKKVGRLIYTKSVEGWTIYALFEYQATFGKDHLLTIKKIPHMSS